MSIVKSVTRFVVRRGDPQNSDGQHQVGAQGSGEGNARGSEAFERADKGTAGHFQHSGMGAPIMRL